MILSYFPLIFTRPKPKDGYNAKNFLTHIWVAESVDNFAGIVAQERREWTYRFATGLVTLTATIGVVLALGWPLWAIAAAFPPLVLTQNVTKLPALQRRMELQGHAAEACVAAQNGADLAAYELKEATAMAGFYRAFRDMTPRTVAALLSVERSSAEKWCARHKRLINRAQQIQRES